MKGLVVVVVVENLELGAGLGDKYRAWLALVRPVVIWNQVPALAV